MSDNNFNLTPIPKDSEILKQFDLQKWLCWLDDIINHDSAYPFSKLTVDGDVIVDIVNYLKSNNVGTYRYEEALSVILNQYADPYSNPQDLIRILNALVIIKGTQSINALIGLLRNRSINNLKGDRDHVLTKVLQALARASYLTQEQKSEIEAHVRLYGLTDMVEHPAYSGNFLRFSYLHQGKDQFFANLKIILSIAQIHITQTGNTQLKQRYLNVLADKVIELHYRAIHEFYSKFLFWFIENNEHLQDNNLFKELIVMVAQSMHKVKELGIFMLAWPIFYHQEHCATLLQFMTALYADLPLKTKHNSLIMAIAYMYASAEPMVGSLESFLMRHTSLLKKMYSSVPYEINSVLGENTYVPDVNYFVIQLFDEVLNTPALDEQNFDEATVRAIFSRQKAFGQESTALAEHLMVKIKQAALKI